MNRLRHAGVHVPEVWPCLSQAECAILRSHSGSLASVPFTAPPIHNVSRMDPGWLRVLLLRRLRMPLPLTARACSLLDVFGHHRAACSRVGELGKRRFAAESAVAQVCRKGGARVSANVMLRDLDTSLVTQITWTTFGGGGGRFVFVRGLPACFGCHHRLSASRRWKTPEEGGRRGWSGAEGG